MVTIKHQSIVYTSLICLLLTVAPTAHAEEGPVEDAIDIVEAVLGWPHCHPIIVIDTDPVDVYPNDDCIYPLPVP